jgi:hypothetical protein
MLGVWIFVWVLAFFLLLLFWEQGWIALAFGSFLAFWTMLPSMRFIGPAVLTIYPEEKVIVRQLGRKKSTINLKQPLTVAFNPLTDDEQDVVRQTILPLHQEVTGTGPKFTRLTIGCLPDDEQIAAGTEEDMSLVREVLLKYVQVLAKSDSGAIIRSRN